MLDATAAVPRHVSCSSLSHPRCWPRCWPLLLCLRRYREQQARHAHVSRELGALAAALRRDAEATDAAVTAAAGGDGGEHAAQLLLQQQEVAKVWRPQALCLLHNCNHSNHSGAYGQ